MKHYGKSKAFVTAIVFLAAGVTVVAPETESSSDLEFTLSTDGGVLYGTAGEYVYEQGISKNFVLSELDWDIKPLPYMGLNFNVTRKNGFYAGASLKCGIAGKTGTITDSDWLNAYYNTDYIDIKTNYSESDAYMEHAFLANLSVGYKAAISTQFSIKPFLALDFMNFKWSGRDGYYQYSDYNSTTQAYDSYTTGTKYPLYGTGLEYEQTYLCPEIGIAAEYSPSRRLNLGASFVFSPAVSCTASDNHFERFLQFDDVMSGGFLIGPKMILEYRLNERTKFSFTAAYALVWGLVGDETMTVMSGADSYYVYVPTPSGSGEIIPYTKYLGLDPGESATYKDSAGASYSAFDLGFGISIAL